MRRSEVYNIPAHVAFTDALAAGLLARFGGAEGDGPVQLARVHVFLPNRRAVRSLTDAFVRASADGGLLLPRMTPVGDLGDDSFERFAAGEAPAARPVTPLRRRLELARLVRAFSARERQQRGAVEALRLADELGATLDALTAEEIDPKRLAAEAVEKELADHWQPTLKFLDIIIAEWPRICADEGTGEGGTRLAAMIDALTGRWAAVPPGPVVAAGILASSPPVGRLLAAVARLPGGMVVLPGLDTAMPDYVWQSIHCRLAETATDERPPRDSEAHPQFALKCLLARLGVERGDVRDWGVATDLDGPAERAAQVAAAMASASAVAVPPIIAAQAELVEAGSSSAIGSGFDKLSLSGGLGGAEMLTGVTTVEAATPAEEAQAIALALRRALETPGASAALVTPDRALARRVAAHCRRWGIDIDDSAGTPLRQTPPGALALALVEAAAQGFAPVALLAVLKHPLVMAGEGRTGWLANVRRLDIALRGVRPPPGLDALGGHIQDWDRDEHNRDRPLLPWWETVTPLLQPLETVADARDTTLPHIAAALRETGDALAGERLWSGPAGRELARLVDALEADGEPFGAFEAGDAPGLIGAFLADVAVRPPYGKHPRLAILGPLEARLQRADVMILGGLNEGTWPRRPSPDPWLAPAIRTRLGLPGTLRDVGLAAHDFVQTLGAKQVILTRARRDDSGPMVPSRFWLRLHAFTGGIARDDDLLRLARRLDGGGRIASADRPAPAPAASARPRSIGVTHIDTLASDPFAYYAKQILRLRRLDPLDQEPTALDRGNLVHKIMERWTLGGGGSLDRLEQIASEELRDAERHPLLRALWVPRARRAIAWAGETVHVREALGWNVLAAEAGGQMVLANGVTLRGRADRIDRDSWGALTVVDYKTGAPPAKSQVRGGFANQLGLIAAMASAGALKDGDGKVVTGTAAALAYWRLSGGAKKPGEEIDPLKGRVGGAEPASPDEHIAFVMARVLALTDRYLLGDAPFTAKLRPELAWDEFDHLARVAEWLGRPA